MLTDSSYQIALYAWVGSAVLALLCLGWWLSYRWRPGWVVTVVFLAGGLLLTPVFPDPAADTLAPALVVAGFQLFTEGYDSAQFALRALGTICAAAVAAALLLWVIVFRGRSSRRVARANKIEAKAARADASQG